MLECSKCGQDERFVQHIAGFQRPIRAFFDKSGAFKAEKGVWRKAERASERFACGGCGADVQFPARFIQAWKLFDRPIEPAPPIDADELLAELRAKSHGAELYVREEAAAPGRFGSIEELEVQLSPALRAGAERLGAPLDRLYSHQIAAIGHAFKGKNVVLQTPTASGKSLCYLLPVFRRLLADEKATALFVFPAKGLSFDQRRKIAQFAEATDTTPRQDVLWPLEIDGRAIPLGVYDGSVDEDADKRLVKEKARIITTTPDALHGKILPYFHTKGSGSWRRFLSNLSVVVLDELHVYRGLFGANVAYVIRRLRMMCERLGAKPQFLCSSATLPEPKVHAESLVGLPFEAVTESGAPRHRKVLVLWNPALQKRKGDRREPTSDALEIVAGPLLGRKRPVQTITFIRSLAGVGKFDMTLRMRLERDRNPCAAKTSTYSGRQDDTERSAISEGLASGQIAHVTSTNALELGIDIGDLNACLLIGYPGTVSSFLQQSGRVGRKGPGVVVLLLQDDPLEQWFGRNPKEFFEHLKRVEPLRLPISNPHVLARQARAAAADLLPEGYGREVLGGLTQDIFERYFGKDAQEKVESVLESESNLPPFLRGGGGAYWIVKATNARDIYSNIRNPISGHKFEVIDEHNNSVGVCDSRLVPRDLFPGAIWVNNGRTYESRKIDYDSERAQVRTLNRPEHLTLALQRTALEAHEGTAQKRSAAKCILWRGGVTVRQSVNQFMKLAALAERTEDTEVLPTKTRPIEFDSTAFWIDFPDALLTKLGFASPEDLWPAMHALEHSMRSVFPIVADVDPGDIGSSFDAEPNKDGDWRGRLFLFDTHAGGTGLSEFAYDFPAKLFSAADRLLASCACKAAEGCPRCCVIAWCEYQNKRLDKQGARKLLGAVAAIR